MMNDEVAAMLKKLRVKLDRDRARAKASEDELFEAVSRAVAAGWSYRQIATAAGIHHSRVGQIATGQARRGDG